MNERQAGIAVIVPVYNTEPYLNQCIKSICDQTFQTLHIIIVDDGSTDQSGVLCDEWAKRDSRIDVIHKENGGPTSAVQAGMALVREDYCAFVDSDDWVSPSLLGKLMNVLETYKVDGVRTGYTVYSEMNKNTKADFVKQPGYFDAGSIEAGILQPFFEQSGDFAQTWSNSRCAKLYRTDLLKQIVFQCNASLRMGEDVELNLRYLPLCKSVYLIPDDGSYYIRIRPDSAQTSFSTASKYQYAEFVDTLKKLAAEQRRTGYAIGRIHAQNVKHLLIHTMVLKCNFVEKVDEVRTIWKIAGKETDVTALFSESGRIFRYCVKIQEQGHYRAGTAMMILGTRIFYLKQWVKKLYTKATGREWHGKR